MRSFSLSLYDPPRTIRDGSAFTREGTAGLAPMAAAFTGTGRLSDICRLYGYIFLLGQNLETEMRECLLTIEFASAAKRKKWRSTSSPERAKFAGLIRMFGNQLDQSHAGSREFMRFLDRARRLRNGLAHGFFAPSEIQYIRTPGGQEKLYDRLKKSGAS